MVLLFLFLFHPLLFDQYHPTIPSNSTEGKIHCCVDEKYITSNNVLHFPAEIACKRSRLRQICLWPRYRRYLWVNFQCCVHLAMQFHLRLIELPQLHSHIQPCHCSLHFPSQHRHFSPFFLAFSLILKLCLAICCLNERVGR